MATWPLRAELGVYGCERQKRLLLKLTKFYTDLEGLRRADVC